MSVLDQPLTKLGEYQELDQRENDGITVTLFWLNEPDTDLVVTVEDSKNPENSTAFEIAPHLANQAFHHPFAYAPVS